MVYVYTSPVLASKTTLALTAFYCFVMADMVYHKAFWNIAIGFNPSSAVCLDYFPLKLSLSIARIFDGLMPDYAVSHHHPFTP
jgi:hypothetical protein